MGKFRDVGVLSKCIPTFLLFLILTNISHAYTGMYDKPELAQEFVNFVGAVLQFCIDFWYIIVSVLAVLYFIKYIPDVPDK